MPKLTDSNRLSLVRQDIAKDWDFELNDFSPKDVTVSSKKNVNWKCSVCGYKWKTQIFLRTRPKIDGIKSRIGVNKNCKRCNSVGTKHPNVVEEWSDKNRKSVFESPTRGKAWWKCKKCKFEWKADISNKAKGYSPCPKCKTFYIKCPELLEDWDYNKNKIDINYVAKGSKIKRWWKCRFCGNEWQAAVYARVHGNGCPSCASIVLLDGTKCSSLTDAYFYLKYKSENKIFVYNKKYTDCGSIKNCRFDFYFHETNTYVEITSFHKNSNNISYFSYLRNIVKKKKFVESIGAKFEFIQHKLTKNETDLVRQNIQKIKSFR